MDTNTAAATLLGVVEEPDGTRVNVSGADLASGADGMLYIWINNPKTGGSVPAHRGLYTLELPASGGVVTASFLGAGGTGYTITGMAIAGGGLGDLVASKREKVPGPGGDSGAGQDDRCHGGRLRDVPGRETHTSTSSGT